MEGKVKAHCTTCAFRPCLGEQELFTGEQGTNGNADPSQKQQIQISPPPLRLHQKWFETEDRCLQNNFQKI